MPKAKLVMEQYLKENSAFTFEVKILVLQFKCTVYLYT